MTDHHDTLQGDSISLAHGNGGKLTHELIASIFVPKFNNSELKVLADSACLPRLAAGDSLVFTTDSHVISPIFFPGGDIGTLSVTGTVNDLAVMGAKPLYLSAGFIIEEGFSLKQLKIIVESMARTAGEAGVSIVTGDTKVVEKGAADGIFINTSGIGVLLDGSPCSGAKPYSGLRSGDAVILSGSIGDHGIAIYAKREGINFETDLKSDCAIIYPLVKAALSVCPQIRIMRDPTRGGLATTLNEFVNRKHGEKPHVGIDLVEAEIPIKQEVKGACELLGFDPLYVANEGKLVIVAPDVYAAAIVDALRTLPIGKEARIIGRVTERFPGKVCLRTVLGSERIIDMLTGEMLPRIC